MATRTYVVNERITLADLNLASALDATFTTITDAEGRKELSHLVRYHETLVNQPAVKKIIPESKLIEKSLQYTPPAKEKKEPKAAAATVEPKAKKEKKKEAEDDDDDEPLVPEEPKAKNPLDSLPKSDFNLEDWKRAYSNMDTRGKGGSLEWFYEK